jgi:hypothetical protein
MSSAKRCTHHDPSVERSIRVMKNCIITLRSSRASGLGTSALIRRVALAVKFPCPYCAEAS